MTKYIKALFCRCKGACLQLLDLPEAPRFVAKGIALGFAFGFLPIPIINIPLSYLIAKTLRIHAAAAALTVCLLKPTMPLYLTLNIITGKLLMGGGKTPLPIDINPVIKIPLLYKALLMIRDLGVSFLAGSVVNAMLAGIIGYFIAFRILQARQRLKKTLKAETANKTI